MQKRTLGNTRLKVTVLGYGTAFRREIPRAASNLLNRLLDAGVNFIDTAPDYGDSEQVIGEAISHRRNEFYLATKCGCNIPRNYSSDVPKHIWTREQLIKNINMSLKRMRTEYVDIWQLHNPSPDSVIRDDLMAVMEEVKKQGKVRHISMSSECPEITTFIDWGVFATFQIPYSALDREHEEIISAAAKTGAGTIIRGGVSGGEPAKDLTGHPKWKAWEQADLDQLRSTGESRSALLLRFTISHPDVHTTIVGTRNPHHLEENLKAVESGPLPTEMYTEVKRRLNAVNQGP